MPHPVERQQAIGRREILAAVGALAEHPGAQGSELVGLDILTGEDRDHPGRGLGRLSVDAADVCGGMGRAQHIEMRLALQHDVVDIAAAAAQQLQILGARRGTAQIEFTHGLPLQNRPVRAAILPFRSHPV